MRHVSPNAQSLLFQPRDGMRVTITGAVSLFVRDGAYQLYCEGLMPEGAGDLQVAYEQLKAKLAAEVKGFDPETVLEKPEIRKTDRFVQYALAAAKEALG